MKSMKGQTNLVADKNPYVLGLSIGVYTRHKDAQAKLGLER